MKTVKLLILALIYSLNLVAQENPAPTPAAVKPEMSLEQAYKREYLFLAAQKRELEARIKKYQKDSSALVRKNESEIEGLQKKYLSVSRASEKASEDLAQSERSLEALSSEREALDNALAQSLTTLKTYVPVAANHSNDLASELTSRFALATDLLKKAQTIHHEAGSFYAQNGTKVEGEILKLGLMASFGKSDQVNGQLAPAGSGEYKIWEEVSAADLSQLEAGQGGAFTVFLHESSQKEATKKEGKSLSDLMRAGGTIGWVIAFLGVLTFIMVIIRGYLIMRAKKGSDELTGSVLKLLKAGQKSEAIELAQKKQNALSGLIETILKAPPHHKDTMENMASEQMIRQWSVIDRFGTLILVAASVAPLLGLLGTVTGMIATFDIITEFGTGDPKMLSSGISEALVTTMFGLIVAIPALMIGSVLSSESDKIKSKMEEAALAVMNELSLGS